MSRKVKHEPFVVRHYSADEAPILKGNGFDGLRVGEDREEAQEFADWVNARLAVLSEVLRCRYSVCTSINPSGYGWDIPRLNEVMADFAADGKPPPATMPHHPGE